MIDTFQTCEHCGQDFPSQSEKLVHSCVQKRSRIRRSTLERGAVFLALIVVIAGALGAIVYLTDVAAF
jgi:hypothetical protein